MQECNLYTCEASYIKTKEMAQSSHEIKHAISGGLLRSISVSAPEAAVLQPSRCLDTNVGGDTEITTLHDSEFVPRTAGSSYRRTSS